MSGLWTPDRAGEFVLVENANAVEVFADGAKVLTGETLARLTFFARRLVDVGEEADARVAVRVVMPLHGWMWTVANARQNSPPLRAVIAKAEGWMH